MRGRYGRQARYAAVTISLLGLVPPAAADAPQRGTAAAGASVRGDGSCPAPDAVADELATLLPPDRLAEAIRNAGPIQVADLGPLFRVNAAGRAREYHDDARDCAHRARVAAVFVALALEPAALPEAPAAPTPAPPPPPPPPPPGAESPPVVTAAVRIDLGAVVDVGLGADAAVAHPGVGLRLTVGRGRLAAVVGASALLPADATVGGVPLRQWRLPVDAGLRLRLREESRPNTIVPYAELGMAATLVSEQATDLATTTGRQYGGELGLRAALGARLVTRARLTVFATLQALLMPSPVSISALPRGTIGDTPAVWLGAAIGGSVGVR